MRIANIITGSPIVADADPNVTEPHPNRVYSTPLRGGRAHGGSFTIVCFLSDGTAAGCRPWVRIPELGNAWFIIDTTPITVNVNEVATHDGVPPDADIFLQVVAPVTGNPTRLACAFM
jgi:hypothetical protein